MTIDEAEVAEHRAAVEAQVVRALRAGRSELFEVLRECEGADPELVGELIRECNTDALTKDIVPEATGDSGWTYQLPAADPERSQWWFAASGIECLRERVLRTLSLLQPNARVVCLGAPSLAGVFATRGKNLTVLDVDEDVLIAVRAIATDSPCVCYDANLPLPSGLAEAFDVCVVDPPWYPDAITTFLARGLQMLRQGGELLSTLPGALTRPALHRFRAELISKLVSQGHELLGLEKGVVRYQVPRFEQVALRQSADVRGIPWRSGDLIHVRKAGNESLPASEFRARKIESFSRTPSHYRVFLAQSTARSPQLGVKRLEKYSSHISTRAHQGEVPDLWSSEKVGLAVGDIETVREVLGSWSRGQSCEEILATFHEAGLREAREELVRRLDEELGLWSTFGSAPPLRTPEAIEENKRSTLSDFATPPSKREHPQAGDGYRATYSRDRDRVLWSSALRRLSDKTQLFPATYDDDLRRRLSHSIEVLQLATTLGDSFGLNRDLIEAGALAHDIGHTPFGHAGEFALDQVLRTVSRRMGFNHYEHGVDVVRYLEGPYYVSNATGFHGLNLTPEVAECILKHTYCHAGNLPSSAEEVWKYSKHQKVIPPGYCHLEGQAVRAADKVSYFISDLEDGIRLGAIERRHLLQCRFFHRPPLNFEGSDDETLGQQFLRQRRRVLALLMEDLIQASSKRLARLSDSSVNGVREHNGYLLQHSDEFLADLKEIWDRVQNGLLHKDRRVVSANLHAGRMVSVLTATFALVPDLIESSFVREHERLHGSEYMNFYREMAGKGVSMPPQLVAQVPVSTLVGADHKPGSAAEVEVARLIMAKDYVAGLTDSRARSFYEQLMNGEVAANR